MRAAPWTWLIDIALFATVFTLFANVEWGTVRSIAYESSTVAGERRMLVYLPPGYSSSTRYPVLYLLHGAGDDEAAWIESGHANVVLDDLHARGQIVPMIVVMPAGFIPPEKLREAGESEKRGTPFEDELLNNIIPFVDAHYPTLADRKHRAIAGVSMGGGQALRIGMRHLCTFGSVGGFALSFQNQDPPLPNLRAGNDGRLSLLWLSCGDKDQLYGMNEDYHLTLEQQGFPHILHVGCGGHEWSVWRDDLSRFAQLLFR